MAGGKWSGEMRLTSDAGTDVNPVAATDAKGRVWVAWQGYRKNNLEILAAAPNGEVAVAWDTYDKGDYDVYFRRLKWDGAVRMEAPVPVAASQNFEARSSIAYDPQSRLWVAYEASSAKWGKDFGAYEATGVSLYQDHDMQVKCFQGPQAFATSANLQDAILGEKKRVNPSAKLPDPENASRRTPNGLPALPKFPLNSFPRLAADPNGTIYLSFRTTSPEHSAMGLVWV